MPAPSPAAVPPGCGFSHGRSWYTTRDCENLAPGCVANNHAGFQTAGRATLVQHWKISGCYYKWLRSGAGWFLPACLSSDHACPRGGAEGGRGARRSVDQLVPSRPGWLACYPRVREAWWQGGAWWVDRHAARAGGENLTQWWLAANFTHLYRVRTINWPLRKKCNNFSKYCYFCLKTSHDLHYCVVLLVKTSTDSSCLRWKWRERSEQPSSAAFALEGL